MYYSALIGHPTEHSVSHILYESLLDAAGISIAYKHIKIDVLPEKLDEAMHSLSELQFCGVSVTLPHKITIMKLVDTLDPSAKELGAVNTIKLGPISKGYNTDWVGIVKPVQNLIESEKLNDIVTIFGTGGAARAAIFAAKQLGATKINVVYRADVEDEKSQDLIDKQAALGIELFDYSAVRPLVQQSRLVINATSAGMIGNAPSPFDLPALDGINLKSKIYFDAVFNPLETPLLHYFKANGAVTIDGLWMMIYQGIEALSIWVDQDIPIVTEQLSAIHSTLERSLHHV